MALGQRQNSICGSDRRATYFNNQRQVGQGAGIYGGSSDTIGGAVDQGDETVERHERDEAAIDGAVAAGETYAAQGTLDDGEGRGGGMALKLSKAQKRHARRGRLKILAKTIEER